jgi:UDP-glucose 4-epimerase
MEPEDTLEDVVMTSRISGVIHFAAYKSVEESIRMPLRYYSNNVCGLVDFLSLLEEFGIKNFVFSSSATVYGEGANCVKNFASTIRRQSMRTTDPNVWHFLV